VETVVNEFWRGRRTFVTGATGLVGSWLVKELLALGAEVVALVRDPDPQSELYRSGDVRRVSVAAGRLEDFETLRRIINDSEPETVFHLAAQTIVGAAHRNPLENFESTLRGTYNLLEACRLCGDAVRRVVVASSDKAYGTQPNLPYLETMPLQGTRPYEVAKSCADLIASAYHQTYGLPVAIARCGNIYGGGDLNWSRIVPGTIQALLAGRRPVIRSDGGYVRDYIYVKDVTAAYLRLAERMEADDVRGEAFNFSPERALTVLELVDLLRDATDCRHLEPDIRNTAKGEIHSQFLDSTKARRRLDWTVRYDLPTGLAETVAWYKNFLSGDALRRER
jgi:CDP-glucose 4,6-dehydratase